jgi:hypothetical protein
MPHAGQPDILTQRRRGAEVQREGAGRGECRMGNAEWAGQDTPQRHKEHKGTGNEP